MKAKESTETEALVLGHFRTSLEEMMQIEVRRHTRKHDSYEVRRMENVSRAFVEAVVRRSAKRLTASYPYDEKSLRVFCDLFGLNP